MRPSLTHMLRVPWKSVLLPLSALGGFLLLYRFRYSLRYDPCNISPEPEQRDTNDQDTNQSRVNPDETANFPLTYEQIDDKIHNFIISISEDAICRLASRHNGGQPCRVVGRDKGSFNICFFIRFENGIKWTIRVPIEPVVEDAWNKVQSEVATMRYIECNTTIPIPHVHGYGKAELVKDKLHVFLICDYISGHPLKMETLAKASQVERKQLYNDLIDILAQLYTLKFPESGSLMPGPYETEPLMSGMLSMSANELQRCYPQQQKPTTFASGEEYLEYQYHVLSKTYCLPTEELSREQAQLELFALKSLTTQLPNIFNSLQSNGPFVLAHLDLRCGNLLVTEDLRIQGIIDWEFTGTIPPCLFTPPPWLTGHDLSAVAAYPYTAAIPHKMIYHEFLQALEEKSTVSVQCADLKKNWEHQWELALPIAEILRQPSSLIRVYYKFIFPKLYQGHRDDIVPAFFESNDNLAQQVQHQIELSEHYTKHLKDQGLLV